jgi:hypothetical protein
VFFPKSVRVDYLLGIGQIFIKRKRPDAFTPTICVRRLRYSKLTTYGYDQHHGGSSTSLPPVGLTAVAVAAATSPSVVVMTSPRDHSNNVGAAATGTNSGRPGKEPERRHSLYDAASR